MLKNFKACTGVGPLSVWLIFRVEGFSIGGQRGESMTKATRYALTFKPLCLKPCCKLAPSPLFLVLDVAEFVVVALLLSRAPRPGNRL